MIKTLQNTLRQDKEQFTVPRSVQDTIPIRRIWPDGIFQFGSKFSKCIRFSDINYAISSKTYLTICNTRPYRPSFYYLISYIRE